MQELTLTPTNKNQTPTVFASKWGNLITYPSEFTIQTTDVTTKNVWNNVLSTSHAKYIMVNLKNFYLNTPLDWFEYMYISQDLIFEYFI